jgi:hypothetical protein
MQIVMDVNGLQAQGYFVYASRLPETSGFALLSVSLRLRPLSEPLAAKSVRGRSRFRSFQRTARDLRPAFIPRSLEKCQGLSAAVAAHGFDQRITDAPVEWSGVRGSFFSVPQLDISPEIREGG